MPENVRTMQLWPGGRSVQVKGDEDGPPEQLLIRDAYKRAEDGTEPTFRQATPEERRAVWIETRAELYQEREVWHCDSSLVDDLLKLAADLPGEHREFASEWQYDNIVGLYDDPTEYSLTECKDWLEEYGHDLPEELPADSGPDKQAVATALQKYQDHYDKYKEDADAEGRLTITLGVDPDGTWELEHDGTGTLKEFEHTIVIDPRRETAIQMAETLVNECEALRLARKDDEDVLDAFREAVRDKATEHQAEIYEWWRISEWLAEQFKRIGVPVLDNAYGYWWGRTTTGQMYLMDGVLQRVAALHYTP